MSILALNINQNTKTKRMSYFFKTSIEMVVSFISTSLFWKIIFTTCALFLISNKLFAKTEQPIKEKKMVVIPKGKYNPFFVTVNSRPEQIASYKMDETPVTNEEYLAFVTANPEWRKSKVNPLFADKKYLNHWDSDLKIGAGKEHLLQSPVVSVSWFAAQAYAKWAGKRLPTVAEWEFAGEAPPKNIKINSLTEYILDWYRRPNPKILPHIKSTYQNAYGLYDMHGLVWEWTFDFNSFIGSTDSRGNNTDEFKAFCAAGAIDVKDKKDYAGFLRFSYRGSLKGNFCIQNLGFRCAKNIN